MTHLQGNRLSKKQFNTWRGGAGRGAGGVGLSPTSLNAHKLFLMSKFPPPNSSKKKEQNYQN